MCGFREIMLYTRIFFFSYSIPLFFALIVGSLYKSKLLLPKKFEVMIVVKKIKKKEFELIEHIKHK